MKIKHYTQEWVIKEYLKVKDNVELRCRNNEVLVFSEIEHYFDSTNLVKTYEINHILNAFAMAGILINFFFIKSSPLSFSFAALIWADLFYRLPFAKKQRNALKRKVVRYFHKKYQGNKNTREEFIILKINQTVFQHRSRSEANNLAQTSTPSFPEHIFLFKRDPKEFCKKYFNLSSPNFIKYYTDRALDNVTKEIETYFIDYSLLIPRRETLGPDHLRKILTHPPKAVYSTNKAKHLETLFKNYSNVQLEAIFTNHQGKDNFNELFTLVPEPLPIYRSFRELLALELFKPKVISPELKALDGKTYEGDTIKVEVLRTMAEYECAGHLFKNCLKHQSSYFTRGGNILNFFRNSQPWACVLIKDREIKEIKGVNNATVEEYLVYDILVKENVINSK